MITTLYVGNLPHGFSKQDLAEVFSCIVEVIDTQVTVQRNWGEINRCGYVTLRDADTAARAMQWFHGRRIFDAPWVVKPAKRQGPSRPQNRLH